MSNEVVMFDPGTQAVSTRFQGLADQIGGDLSSGVGGGFAVLSIKGSRWRVKYQGKENPILAENGDPVASIEAVIIKANDLLTKQYYAKGFEEGDNSAPVCFSLDGKVPAAGAPEPQHANCATCPKNAFGSKVNPETGKKSKACQDNRKLAIVPLADLKNELFGGPMLLRVPAAALKDLAMFGDTLKARGYPYNSVAVRIGFDISVSYPKPIFKAIRVLTDDEADVVLEWYQSDAVQKILADFDADIETGASKAQQQAEARAEWDAVFEIPPTQAQPPVAKPTPAAAKPAPAAAKPAAAKPATKPAAAKPATPPPAAKPQGVSFGAKPATKPATTTKVPPAPAAQPEVVEAAPAAQDEPQAEPEVVPGNLEADIASILSDLNGIAGQ